MPVQCCLQVVITMHPPHCHHTSWLISILALIHFPDIYCPYTCSSSPLPLCFMYMFDVCNAGLQYSVCKRGLYRPPGGVMEPFWGVEKDTAKTWGAQFQRGCWQEVKEVLVQKREPLTCNIRVGLPIKLHMYCVVCSSLY